jgi:hypothetical protein
MKPSCESYLGGVRLACGWLADFPNDRPWFRRAGIGLRPDQNRGDHVFRTGLAMIDAIEPEAELFALAEQVDLAEKLFMMPSRAAMRRRSHICASQAS